MWVEIEELLQLGPFDREGFHPGFGDHRSAGEGSLQKGHFSADIAFGDLCEFSARSGFDACLPTKNDEDMARLAAGMDDDIPLGKCILVGLVDDESPVVRSQVFETVPGREHRTMWFDWLREG